MHFSNSTFKNIYQTEGLKVGYSSGQGLLSAVSTGKKLLLSVSRVFQFQQQSNFKMALFLVFSGLLAVAVYFPKVAIPV